MFTQIPSDYIGKIHKIFQQEEELVQLDGTFLRLKLNLIIAEAPKQEIQQTNSTTTIETKQTITSSHSKLAKQEQIFLKLQAQGNILKTDLEKPVEKGAATTATTTSTPATKAIKDAAFNIIKISDFQKGMQKSMTEANTIPHLYLKEDVDLTELAEMREQIKKDKNITYMTFLIKSFSLALSKFPILISTYYASKSFEYIYQQHSSHNVQLYWIHQKNWQYSTQRICKIYPFHKFKMNFIDYINWVKMVN